MGHGRSHTESIGMLDFRKHTSVLMADTKPLTMGSSRYCHHFYGSTTARLFFLMRLNHLRPRGVPDHCWWTFRPTVICVRIEPLSGYDRQSETDDIPNMTTRVPFCWCQPHARSFKQHLRTDHEVSIRIPLLWRTSVCGQWCSSDRTENNRVWRSAVKNWYDWLIPFPSTLSPCVELPSWSRFVWNHAGENLQ